MKYFIREEERKALGGTCYYEFQKGEFQNKFWLNDSICLHAEVFDTLLLSHLISDSIENFNYFGPTEINKEQWDSIIMNSESNEHWKSVVEELKPWVDECFTNHMCFTICGI